MFASEKWWEEYGHALGVRAGMKKTLWSLHCCFCTVGTVLVWVLGELCLLSSRNSCQFTVLWFLCWGVKEDTRVKGHHFRGHELCRFGDLTFGSLSRKDKCCLCRMVNFAKSCMDVTHNGRRSSSHSSNYTSGVV